MPLTKVQQGMSENIVSGTAVTASGTSVDFNSIPAGVKRVTVMFSGVSTNGISIPLIQLGSSVFQTINYQGKTFDITTGVAAYSSGFSLTSDQSAAHALYGSVTLSLSHPNYWLVNGILSRTDNVNQYRIAGGVIISAGTLDRIRITTVNGTDVFDAGTINIMYE